MIAIRMVEVGLRSWPESSLLEVGDMFFLSGYDEEELRRKHLTAHYYAENRARNPLVLMLPGRGGLSKYPFLVDGQCYNGQRGYYDGWTVTGHPPFISVMPSVDIEGVYHGYIGANGVAPGFIGPDL